ncbi:hypothetical protein [Xylophilus ampelinus]|uniref:Uncharacterized protein n=1 Tax=Xylophilus ampelinus TaxID=54067 RepID=A0A318SLG3_9BURK|nr:hypothetical protein [Xylophilus ampelinus]MCS4509137.1 hypothetical protein [Xylophilus ampelinus]PYE79835.1 hypothetical protein DFQ15_101155 [Xylophilus ampelinus]
MTLADLPQSPGWAITSALLGAIGADALLSTLPLVRNPRRAQHLDKGDVVLILAEKTDNLQSAAGVAEMRQRTVSLGVLCRALGADAQADAVYHHLHLVAYDALRALQTAGNAQKVAETGVQFHVDDIDIDGAIVVGGWAIDYRYKRPL